MLHRTTRRVRWAFALCAAACGVNAAPVIDKIADQTAAVGVELEIHVRSYDPDGDSLSFAFAAPELPDLEDRKPPATIDSSTGGVGIFRWVPTAKDSRAEPYTFAFKVSDGRDTSTASVQVTVRDGGASGAPVFVKPLGSGTTLQLDQAPCVEVPVEVNDTDSTQVALAQEDPLIPGATLTQDGAFTATWRWCPTAEQVQAQDRFYLRLSADDRESPKVLKLPPFLIVVIGSNKNMNCPGAGPTLAHTSLGPQTTVQDFRIDVMAADDKGLKSTPLVYWSTTDPGTPPNLGALAPVASTRTSGDALSGTYQAVVPNPVASSPPGTTKTLYYLIAARDNDDPTGGCNHTTYLPQGAAYSFTVTTGGTGGLAACEACTSDAQCGGPDDNCVTIGGALRCGVACGAGCAAGSTCSGSALVSVDGKSAKQCVPASGSCVAAVSCTDDALEQNDAMGAIANTTAQGLTGTSYPNLMICPATGGGGVDEDWFGVPVTQEGRIQVSIASSATTDLDLDLLDAQGNLLSYGFSASSNETVSACVPASAGTLFARVYSISSTPAPAPYALTISRTPMVCPCQLDLDEPDDDAAHANPAGRPTTPYVASNLTICPSDVDFYAVTLDSGDRLTVDLTFNQIDANGDLDIHLFKPDGTTDLTPCSPAQPASCQFGNGQGAESNEHFVWTAPAGQGGKYYVVVRGYDSSDSNSYSISMSVQ